ncbi:MAG: hypothetical protein CO170_01355 [candidate division SR1 bacterium CG_4_9_14_3_um_filter_40_9]|nr:MAG: hypothetical protein CO170_01355 [candidate division SR1 bacterium CG_4_9_14_3_um_filter_40_9]
MKTFHILTFGCQMNYADSARIRAVLQHCGFSYEEDIKKADIVIFETCSVRQKSEDKITGKLKEIRPDQKVWITGCMIQHNFRSRRLLKSVTSDEGQVPSQFQQGNFFGSLMSQKPTIVGLTNSELELLDTRNSILDTVFVNHAFNPLFHILQKKWRNLELFRRIDDTGFLPLMLERLGYKVNYEGEFINEYEKIIPESITSMNMHTSTAYVPISTGCNQFCAYCIVPYARGLEKYFPVEQIVKECEYHIKHGAKEIVLLGQIVNKHPQFVEIIKKILALKDESSVDCPKGLKPCLTRNDGRGLKRLRYTSPYPTYFSKELLALHGKEEKLCPHIHMPLQSGSDAVLKRMFRGYSVTDAKKFIDDVRKLKRDISITTDIIIGFPGETEKDFEQTLKFVEHGRFDMIYMGIYSSRPGTLAQKKYPDDVSREVKRERWNRLNEVLKRISRENNEKEIGNIHEMLVNEIKMENGKRSTGNGIQLIGYTDNMKQITCNIQRVTRNVGDFVKVKIIKGAEFKLSGEMLP